MSKLSRFTEEELKSVRVWKSPGFAALDTPQPKTAIPAPPVLTVDEIEAIQQQAHREAFAQGHQEGQAEGYTAGFSQGVAEGQAQGQAEGQAQGQAEGLKQGLAEAEKQLCEQAEQFSKLMASLSEPFKVLDEAVEQQLVALSIAIASQLIRREIKQNPGEIMAVVRSAVAVLPVAVQKLTLYLHPADADLVKSSLALNETISSWQIIEDPLLTPGGCKVTTDVSLVDATIEKRLAAVIAMIWGDTRESLEPSGTFSGAAVPSGD